MTYLLIILSLTMQPVNTEDLGLHRTYNSQEECELSAQIASLTLYQESWVSWSPYIKCVAQ